MTKTLSREMAMGFFGRLLSRLSGAYRKEWFDAIQSQRAAIPSLRGAIARAGIHDPRIVAIPDQRLRTLEIDRRFLKTAAWIGAPTARRLYRQRYSEIAKEVTRPWLGSGGEYDFSGAKLPLVDGMEMFIDSLLVYHLLDGIDGSIIFQAFGDDGPYEPNDTIRLRENDVVLDCGASIGCFSAIAAARGCRVYAFEPSRYICERYLEKTAALNDGITVCPYAASDAPGRLEFVLYREKQDVARNADAGGFVLRRGHLEADGAADPNKMEEERERFSHATIETVEAVRLDDFVEQRGIDRVDFIKADIEGAERKMLAGAVGVMKRFAPKLSICTYHLPDDPEVLTDIIMSAQPKYTIMHGPKKLYAHVE